MRRLRARIERFALREAFVISRGAISEAAVVSVEIEDEGHRGRGECVPYSRYRETPEGVLDTVLALGDEVAAGLDRETLLSRLPAGAARNALDCALWDLEARRSATPVWSLAGLAQPQPQITAFTLSLDSPKAMEAAARRNAYRPLLKLKLGADAVAERLRAVRRGAPDARLIVDANEAWDLATFRQALPVLEACGVEMIEQPLPAGADAALDGFESPIALAADESCHTVEDVDRLAGRYAIANIKLDKTGGLSAALALDARARAVGLETMVGCMVGTSLAMAPAFLLAGSARYVDLDGPLLLAHDRENAMVEIDGRLQPPHADLWGGGQG